MSTRISYICDHHLLQTDKNIRLSGHVSWVGRSSMEVCIWVDQLADSGKFKKIFNAIFLMVARDPINKRAALVNPLVGGNEQETAYIKMGEGTSSCLHFYSLIIGNMLYRTCCCCFFKTETECGKHGM